MAAPAPSSAGPSTARSSTPSRCLCAPLMVRSSASHHIAVQLTCVSIHAEVLYCMGVRFDHVCSQQVEHDSAVPALAAVVNMELGFSSQCLAEPSKRFCIHKAAHSALHMLQVSNADMLHFFIKSSAFSCSCCPAGDVLGYAEQSTQCCNCSSFIKVFDAANHLIYTLQGQSPPPAQLHPVQHGYVLQAKMLPCPLSLTLQV